VISGTSKTIAYYDSLYATIDGTKLFGVNCLLVPINDALHWTLLVISGTRKTISYYDSLYSNPGKYTAVCGEGCGSG